MALTSMTLDLHIVRHVVVRSPYMKYLLRRSGCDHCQRLLRGRNIRSELSRTTAVRGHLPHTPAMSAQTKSTPNVMTCCLDKMTIMLVSCCRRNMKFKISWLLLEPIDEDKQMKSSAGIKPSSLSAIACDQLTHWAHRASDWWRAFESMNGTVSCGDTCGDITWERKSRYLSDTLSVHHLRSLSHGLCGWCRCYDFCGHTRLRLRNAEQLTAAVFDATIRETRGRGREGGRAATVRIAWLYFFDRNVCGTRCCTRVTTPVAFPFSMN